MTSPFILIREKVLSFLNAELDRLTLWLPVAFGAGIGFYFSLSAEPLLSTGLAAFLCGGFLLRDTRKNQALRLFALFVFLFVSGFFLTQVRTRALSAPRIKYPLSAVQIAGTVEDVSDFSEGAQVTVGNVKIKSLAGWKTPRKIRLTLPENVPVPQTGDEIEAVAYLSAPKNPVTPTGFDAARQLYFKKIGAVGSLEGNIQIVKPAKTSPLRDKINKRIDTVLPDDTQGIAKALVTGGSKSVPSDIVQTYRNAGIAHILAVSGLHMSLLAGLIFFVIRSVLALIPKIALYYNTKKIAAGIALIACAAYLHISGASFAAQRAFIMVAFVLIAALLNRRALSVVSVAWAAFFILLFKPEAILSAGFQLSFAAVTTLICAYEKGNKEYTRFLEKREGFLFSLLSGIVGVLMASVIASAATAPFALFHFRQLPLYAVFISAIATTLTGFWVMPALTIGTILMPFDADKPFLISASYGIKIINRIAETAAGLPHAVLSCPPMPVWGLAFAAFGGLWFCLWKGRVRLFGLMAFALSLVSPFLTTVPDVYVGLRTAAFRNNDGLLVFREKPLDRRTRQIWLNENHQTRLLTTECAYGLCLYEKNGYKIGVANTKIGAYDACEMKDLDILFITVNFDGQCAAKRKVTRSELSEAGVYMLTLAPEKIIVKTVSENKGFRPWSTSYPFVSLIDEWKGLKPL
ncbi:MAG: ComEC family competence protein [Alphaproteobacteria bacterium]|nr:ComEC family competence protein [Alphaproteobacteria bacterium]